MNKNLIVIFSLIGLFIFMIFDSNVSMAASGYQSSVGYQGGVKYPGLKIYQNNNSYYSHNGYNKSSQITEEREQDASGQTQQVQEMRQWMDDHPGQKEQLHQMFESN